MTVYKEDEVKEIADAGFNFTRIHLDTRYFFSDENENSLENAGLEFVGDIETVNLTQYENLDRLIEWCIMNDIHICFARLLLCPLEIMAKSVLSSTFWGFDFPDD